MSRACLRLFGGRGGSRVGLDVQYQGGAWARHIVEGSRPQGSGNCIIGGDSGGPVYPVRADTAVAAKGIISGQNSDPSNCYVFFTDTWDAYYGLPGQLTIG
jgi:hypothetical protein